MQPGPQVQLHIHLMALHWPIRVGGGQGFPEAAQHFKVFHDFMSACLALQRCSHSAPFNILFFPSESGRFTVLITS